MRLRDWQESCTLLGPSQVDQPGPFHHWNYWWSLRMYFRKRRYSDSTDSAKTSRLNHYFAGMFDNWVECLLFLKLLRSFWKLYLCLLEILSCLLVVGIFYFESFYYWKIWRHRFCHDWEWLRHLLGLEFAPWRLQTQLNGQLPLVAVLALLVWLYDSMNCWGTFAAIIVICASASCAEFSLILPWNFRGT